MKHLLIFDPGMLSSFGHHYAYNRALLAAARARGLSVQWLFSASLPENLAREFQATPPLPPPLERSTYDMHSALENAPAAVVADAAAGLARSIGASLKAAGPLPDIILAHTLEPAFFLALLQLRAFLPEGRAPALALNLMLGVDDSARCRETLALAAPLLRHADHAALFAGTRSAAALLQQITGRAVAVLPSPLPPWLGQCARPSGPQGPLFSLFGDGRGGKNLHILPAALMRYIRGRGAGRFSIRMTPTALEVQDLFLALHDLSREFPARVALSLERLEEREYYESLGRADALLLPYAASAYSRFRPSGLVIEAAALGVPVICADGGFMAEELSGLDNGSLLLHSMSPASLSDAFFLFEKDYAQRKARALDRAAAYRAGQNADALLDLVLALGG